MLLYYCVFLILLFIVVYFFKNNNLKESFLEFIHIPKNAGTTIENIANEKDIKWGRYKPAHRNKVGTEKCTYWHVPPKHFYINNFYDSDDTFCVFREPLSRLISEYSYRHKGQPEMDNKIELNKWLRKELNDENVLHGGLNCHFLPQNEFIYNENNERTCKYILDFDNLTTEFNDLMQKYDINLNLEDQKKDNKSNFNLTIHDIDKDNLEIIKAYYKSDFNLHQQLSQK